VPIAIPFWFPEGVRHRVYRAVVGIGSTQDFPWHDLKVVRSTPEQHQFGFKPGHFKPLWVEFVCESGEVIYPKDSTGRYRSTYANLNRKAQELICAYDMSLVVPGAVPQKRLRLGDPKNWKHEDGTMVVVKTALENAEEPPEPDFAPEVPPPPPPYEPPTPTGKGGAEPGQRHPGAKRKQQQGYPKSSTPASEGKGGPRPSTPAPEEPPNNPGGAASGSGSRASQHDPRDPPDAICRSDNCERTTFDGKPGFCCMECKHYGCKRHDRPCNRRMIKWNVKVRMACEMRGDPIPDTRPIKDPIPRKHYTEEPHDCDEMQCHRIEGMLNPCRHRGCYRESYNECRGTYCCRQCKEWGPKWHDRKCNQWNKRFTHKLYVAEEYEKRGAWW